ncbi:MAG: methyl-accepting chemotaxis protein [Litoreibacter sp.]|nr:methyl-accepting chemotaxis protein [Litoreibacter sp.]
MKDFTSGWDAYTGSVADDLRRLYIADNPNPVGKKDELVLADDGSDWSAAHGTYHESLRAHQRARGYYDLFLFDTRGELIYSVFKEDDFALNFRSGKYASSGLGEVFQEAVSMSEGQFFMTEIAPYAPSADAPALFMATPVFENGKQLGVVAIQLPLDVLGTILSDAQILGNSGELFLADSTGRALNDSRFENRFSTLDSLPDTAQMQTALTGESRYFSSTTGVNGETVVAMTSSFTVPSGATWSIILEKDRAEALSVVNQMRLKSIIELAVIAAVLSLIVWFAARSVIQRINRLAQDMDQIAAEDYELTVEGQGKNDEIGDIAKTLANLLNRLKEGAAAKVREKETQAQNTKVVETLSAVLKDLANGDFRNTVEEPFPEEHAKLRISINEAITSLSAVIQSVRMTSENVGEGSSSISASAADLSRRTEEQAATLSETATSLEQITSSVTEATDSVDQIERTVLKASNKAEESGAVVTDTINTMSEIKSSSDQISQIISVIDDIAFQTNLLALNAGVEAARAGDAGRGFAVVASEVRALAQRSSEAAREIKELIDTSSDHVSRGVDMVGRTGEALSDTVSEVREISEMIKNVAASSRAQSKTLIQINEGMARLDNATQQNAAMSEENTAAAQVLQSEADRLLSDVGQFKTAMQGSEKTRASLFAA